jgi:hypothetical protein
MATRTIGQLLIAAGIYAAGEGIGTIEPFLSSLITSLGPTGFVVWFAWYTVTRTLPKMQDEHTRTVEQLATEHRTTVERLASENRAMVDRMAAAIDGMVAHCKNGRATA